MSNFSFTTPESRQRWETNADHWDARMGDKSNLFHRTIVRPHTEELLKVQCGDLVLDIACGTGNFSERLAELGAKVVAFDFSKKMIGHARRRRSSHTEKIEFYECDATDYDQLIALKKDRPFDKAVANMAVMDIADIGPLFKAVSEMLKPGGVFVFSTHHPCFIKPSGKYFTSCVHEGEGLVGQPVKQLYYHRPLQEILGNGFSSCFVMDGFFEEPDDDPEFPVIIIVRMRKT
ncbi:class I SAM-dependent methyltransferase [Methanospirillum lacunae]|uniref:Class I SAM-dependent methyltransferase n=1 Tax=Methanospirillum lacunae TaxID=668570 RepID=A0A2V2N6Z6_9EURY|nr:class I SAM-dependent methyltransferase [Methanospirillum lacunae]PWR71301.1 class I SAM-dependent methyltransferase [Methanospirillum lacunae]